MIRETMKIKKMCRVAAGALALAGTMSAAFGAARPYPGSDEPAQEIRLRGGIPNVLAKMAAGKPISVVYLGGSITQMNGWRNGTTKLLKGLAPKSAVTEVNAGIGGTGSDLGAFRVGRDALCHNPDLLFVEFATNDGWNGGDFVAGTMEGIVRQTWKHDPSTDIVFVYTITESATNSYLNGKCTAAAAAHERVANHYGIPSVNFGPRVAERLKAGTLLIRGGAQGAPTPVVRQTAKGDKAAACVVFANDGTHPNREGHDIYVESLAAFFKAAQAKAGKPGVHALPAPLVASNLENAKIVPLTREMLSGNWEEVVSDKPWYMGPFGGRMWQTATPGAKITFAVRGKSARLYDLVGPDGGQAIVRVDGREVHGRPLPRFDAYCTYHRINPLPLSSFSDDKVHVVEITLDSKEPSREAVAESKEKPEKYRGTKMWAAGILVDGDVVPLPKRIALAPAKDGTFPAQELFRKVRGIWGKDPAADIEVVLADGSYRFTSTVIINQNNDTLGKHTGRLTLRAENRGKAFFTGGVEFPELVPATGLEDVNFLENPVRGDPRKHILMADLKAAGITDYGDPLRGMRLVWNGQLQTVARWPNDRWSHIADPVGIVKGAKEMKWKHPGENGSWVRFGIQNVMVPGETRPFRWLKEKDPCGIGFFTSGWASHSFQFGKIDPATCTIWEKEGVPVRGNSFGFFHSCGREHPWYAFNILCELDRPGEYYIDREKGILYFWPPSARDRSPGACELTVAGGAFLSQQAGPLTLEGIVFQNFRGTALAFQSPNVSVVSCAIRNIGMKAIDISHAENARIAGCDIYNVGSMAVVVSTADSGKLVSRDHNIVIENNHIHDMGQEEHSYVPGVWIWGQGVVVRDNTINSGPHAGIGNSGREVKVIGNDIFDMLRLSNEMGAYYCGRDWTTFGNVIAFNRFRDMVLTDKTQLARAIMIDDGGAGYTIVSNEFRNIQGGGVCLSDVGNRVQYNTFEDVYPTPMDCWGGDNALMMDANWKPQVNPEVVSRIEAQPVDQEPWISRYPLVNKLRECLRGKAKKPPEARTVIQGNAWWYTNGDKKPFITWKGKSVVTNESAWIIRDNVNEKRPLPQRRYGCYPSPERFSWPLAPAKKAPMINLSSED